VRRRARQRGARADETGGVGVWLGIVAGEGVKMILLFCFVATSDWEKLATAAVARAELEERAEEEDVARLAAQLGFVDTSEKSPLLLNY
jgi:hypothetical protein